MSNNQTPITWKILIVSKYERELSYLRDRYPERYSKLMNTLTLYPEIPVGSGEVSALKGNKYHGGWEYRGSIGSQTLRLFYRLSFTSHTVYIYYAGPKPNVIPPPPPLSDLERLSDVDHSNSKKKGARRR
jgi:mRNA-degrading endonuclease RelE of RelBE toxin-antitoxin system